MASTAQSAWPANPSLTQSSHEGTPAELGTEWPPGVRAGALGASQDTAHPGAQAACAALSSPNCFLTGIEAQEGYLLMGRPAGACSTS